MSVRRTAADRAGGLIEVLDGGASTTVQDHPGRTGYWHVGVPPNGPMDDLSHRLVNRVVGNSASAAALELTGTGPMLRFVEPAVIALGGRPVPVDGRRRGDSAVDPDRGRGRRGAARRCPGGPRAPRLPGSSGRDRRAGVPREPFDVHPRKLRRPRRSNPWCRRPPDGGQRVRGRTPTAAVGSRTDAVTRLVPRCAGRSAHRSGVPHLRGARRPLPNVVGGALQLGPDRDPAHRTETAVGTPGRRRGRSPPLEHPRHRLRHRGGRPHRGHAGHPRTRRTEPGWVRLSGRRGHGRAVEARPAPTR